MKVRCFRRKIFSILLITVLVVSVASVLDFGFVPAVYATELLSSGWENSAGSDLTDGGEWTSTSGTNMSVVDTTVQTGSYSAFLNITVDDISSYVREQFSPLETEVWAQTGIYVDALGANYIRNLAFLSDDLGNAMGGVGIQSDGDIYVRWSDGSTSYENVSSTSVTLDTWQNLTFYFKCHATEGAFTVWLDGAELEDITTTGKDTRASTDLEYFGVGCHRAWTGTKIYFDDVEVSDTAFGGEEETISGSITDLTYPYNTTTKNQVAMFKANWTTSGTLDSYWWSHDFADGENYVNQTAKAFSDTWSNDTFTLPNSIDTFYAKCYANTTTGVENVTSTISILTMDEYNIYLELGDATTVQSAENQMDDYENSSVYLPAGNFTWSTTDQVINQDAEAGYGVNFFGASDAGCQGHENDWAVNTATTILHKPQNATNNFFNFGGHTHGNYVNDPVRVSGIQFEADAPDNSTVEMGGTSGISLRQIPDYRIDNCTFINMAGTAVAATADDGWADSNVTCYGVIDHCIVNNTYKLTGENWAWGYGFYAIGDSHNDWITDITLFRGQYGWLQGVSTMYIEDCHTSCCRHSTDAMSNGYYVSRFNLHDKPMNEYSVGMSCLHGPAYPSGRGTELYNNTYNGIDPAEYPWGQAEQLASQLRGGAHIFTNNTFTMPINDANSYMVFLSAGDDGGSQTEQSINQTYIWDNTVVNASFLTELDPNNYLDENEEYFLRAPTVEDDGFVYLPYPYPHPLVSGEEATYYYLNVTAGTGGTTYPDVGEHAYLDGLYASVEAFPSAGYSFANWTLDAGDGGTDNPTSIYMTANHTIQPVFNQISYIITLTPNPTFLTQGETVSITASATKNAEAFTAYIMNITKDGTLWKQNIVEANSTFTDQSTTATSHTYSVSALYDSDAGGEVDYSITPLTLYWNTPPANPDGEGTTPPPYIEPDEEPDEPTAPPDEIAETDITFLVVGIAAITLIAIGLVFVTSGEEKKLKRWSVQKPKRWRV